MKTLKTSINDFFWKIFLAVDASRCKCGKSFIYVCLLLSSGFTAVAATRYVNVANPTPLAPYTSWASAATTMQDAIDVAAAGDVILVTNGVYQTGARAVDRLSNRVAVTKAVTLQSINGPSVTTIIGNRDPRTTNGDAAVRCVYLTNRAVLSGFTLTNGATQTWGNDSINRSGGGVFCESGSAVVTNCVLAGNTSSDEGGGAYRGTLNNCTLVGNSVMDQNGQGGGAYNATLNNCELVGNTAVAAWNANGGGAAFGTLNNCKLIGNFSDNGGGAYAATLNNCTLSGNSAEYGGGACAATLNNCTLIANSATEDGGGILSGWLRNCMLMANSAKRGGGASGHYYHGSVTLTNCTLVANSGNQGGGANEAQLKNCILYYNTALFGENYFNSSMNYCCTSPSPSAGTGNITAEPALASFIRLSTHSPCRAAGSAAYASGVDLDGEPWASPPSIGCDEYWSGSVTGALNVAVVATHTNGVAGSPLDFQAVIHGRASASSWDFGDGVIVSNRPFASHTWSAPGDYLVTIIAYNDTYPSGVSATVAVHVASQPVHYVSLSNPLPLAPYTSWTTAATNIQDAVDAAAPGALVLVGNGVYQSGARTVYGMSNRVAVTKAITIRSVNGPLVTTISGYQLPGIANGPAAVRCVYLTNSAVLSGFTLTNGATQTSGNSDTNQSGGGIWCESSSALVTNCILTGNTASDKGGGIYFGTLNNSTLTGNSASDGGGAFYSVLNDCMLSSNSVASSGGGAYNSTLNNCALSGNSAGRGGGAYSGTLNNCTLTSNSAAEYGGGAHSSTLNNCMVMGNSASDSGGGIFSGTLNNCTLTLNRASFNAGGAYGGTLNNCIVYYNSTWLSEPNYDSSTLNFCCTFPMPKSGTGNITNEPVLASFSHLSEASPCRGVGSAAYVRGVDLDGELWANPPSIGCDEYWTGSVTGSLSAGIVASFTNVVVGVPVDFQALIEGRLSASRWDFGDGGVISNRPSVSHAWAAPGNYSVELRAYNQDHPAGVAATVMVHVVAQSVHYVASSSTNPVYPYTNWLTAATNIQDAVDAAPAGALVRVTNGVYQSGTRVIQGRSNRVAVTKPMTVSSVNGPVATAIVGSGLNNSLAVRCVYLASGAVIAGFTLTNGATQSSGGGAWCESTNAMLTNCVLSGNTASCGGGVYFGTLNNCTLTGNSAVGSFGKGGGAYYSAVINCDVTSNSADSGGGAYSCTLYNCTLTGNSAESEGGGAYNSTLNNCTLSSNSVDNFGGGASHSSLNNCVLTWNSATGWLGQGGGAYRSTLNNCTLTGNSAVDQGGGDCWSTLNNCIVYYNRTQRSGPNYSLSRLNYCCTYPMPSFGTGNITNEPVLASTSRLSSQSPCREAGSLVYAMGLDIDGEEWGSPPSMGCDEYRSGAVSGSLAVAISATYTNLAVGLPVDFQAIIGGRLSASRWDFGDGTVVSNQPYTSHSWLSPGVYVVELRGFNETHPIGVTTTVTMHVLNQPIHYVSLASTNPLPPYTSWATAATNIQAGVDAATVPGSLVLVGNGAYKAGERPSSLTTSRVIVDKPVVVRSVNGPSYTHILGENGDFSLALRCVYLTNRAVLSGFTLTRGWSWASDGGGVWCESASAVVTNCVITGNLADFYGGGAFSGTLYNCTLMGNVASDGGGAYSSTLNNCTLSDNSTAGFGGGVRYSTLNNCTLTRNTALKGGGVSESTLNNCTLTANSAIGADEGPPYSDGGGAYLSTLDNCILANNVADYGGGAKASTLNNCTVTGNSALIDGGGTHLSSLNNCTLSGNSGGGVYGGRIANSTLTGNFGWGAHGHVDENNRSPVTLDNCVLAGNYGVGVRYGSLTNCTVVGNTAGGASYSTLKNCIVYYNTTGNYDHSTNDFCCTTPLPTTGTNNIIDPPLFINPSGWSDLRLQASSPCINVGNNGYASSSTDLDGNPRIFAGVVDLGAYESTVAIVITAQPANQTMLPGQTATFSVTTRTTAPLSYYWKRDGVFIPGANTASYSATNVQLSDSGSQFSCLVSNIYGTTLSSNATLTVLAPVYYVALASANPVPPYTNWATAADNIQDALEAAVLPGSLVLVSNGVYQAGATAVYGMSNRVAVIRAVTVKSVNGPSVTTIVGYQVPGTTNGPSAVRCVYLTNGAVLSGFTLTNGATQTSGDLRMNESGGGVWCESASAVVTNCVLTGNAAYYFGGGTYYGTFNNCTLTRNSANRGGGAYFSTLNNCELTGNAATGSSGDGGGAYYGTLNNCALTGNFASSSGGGSYYGALNNCTLAGNSAIFGGGSYNGALTNCIVYYNNKNYSGGTLDHCCTTPSTTGAGNFTNAPLFADTNGWSALQLQAGSPCINAGNNAYAPGTTDLDGYPRIWGATVDIGAYEYHGAIAITTQPADRQVLPSQTATFSVTATGTPPLSYQWQRNGAPIPGATVSTYSVSNVQLSDTGTRFSCLVSNPYDLLLSSNATLSVLSPVYYVALTSTNPMPPYTSWATAATNIQDALGAAILPGSLVLVSNGVYQAGATAVYGMSNRVAVTRAVTVKSVNGSSVTTIVGSQVPGTTNGPSAVRCVYLTNGAVLSGFTLTNGATQTSGDLRRNESGGGVWCESVAAVLTNCLLVGNSARYYGGAAYQGTLNNCRLIANSVPYNDGGGGGGVYSGTLNNCVLTSNSARYGGGTHSGTLNNCALIGNLASWSGGGAQSSILLNCTVVGNSAIFGGGSYSGSLTNCIVYYNNGNYTGGTLDYSCTTPLPSGNTNNLAGEPRFLNTNGWTDLRLQSNSTCINVGNNAYAPGLTDLDGNARINSSRVDIGAYEFQFLDPFHAWLAQYGLPTDGSADYTDPDHDGMNNWQEWRSGTAPTNAMSALRLLTPVYVSPSVIVRWQSVSDRNYFIERGTNSGTQPFFLLLRSNILGQASVTTYTDTNAVGRGPVFYRIGVQE